MTFIAAAAVVGSALISSNAAENAADTQAGASREATQAQRDMFERQIQLQEPWRQGGGLGLNALLFGLGLSPGGTFTPGAATPLTQGADGVFAPAAAPAAAAPGGLTPDQVRQMYEAGMLEPHGGGQPFTNRTTGAQVPAWMVAQAVGGFSDSPASGPVTTFAPPGGATAATAPTATAPTTAPATPPTGTVAGGVGYGSLMHDFGLADFQADPGYAFRLSEGEKAIQRAKSASGGLGSGGYLKDLTDYSQGMASQEFGNAFGRYNTNRGYKLNALQALSGTGQSATNNLSAAAGQFGQQIGSNIIGAGNAQAAGQVGSANAINGAVGQGISLYQQNQMLQRFPYYGGTPYAPSGPATMGDFPVAYYG